MKVVYCYLTADTDGSKIHVDSFMSAFTALGETVIDAGVITRPFSGNKAEWSLAKKIWAKSVWLRRNLKVLDAVWRKARRARADVLIVRHMPNQQLFLPTFVLSFLYPVVLEVNAIRAIEDPTRSNLLTDVLDRLTFCRVKRIFVVSRIMKDFLLNRYCVKPGRTTVVENGVDVEKFTPGRPTGDLRKRLGLEGRFVAGFVGSFKPWHGIGNIIEVAAQVAPQCPDIRFLIVGDGKERAKHEAQVKARGLAEHFVFTGFVPHRQVRDYLTLMDVALAPHRTDSFQQTGGFHGSPLKIFEYMAMAKAIIATPIWQISEMIVDGKSGRLIYAEDEEEMREEVLRLHADPEYRRRLGANARTRVATHYTWKLNAEKVRVLCQEAIGNHS
jgi:glycosyltransferase involved in cell wall biosynthesis